MQAEITDTSTVNNQSELDDRYLVFRLGGELYGVALDTVREVMKRAALKRMPFVVKHFAGVMNLRGQVIGVIDLRLKFGLPVSTEGNELILVTELGSGLLGTIVDDVVSVAQYDEGQIDRSTKIESKVPTKFLKGIAKSDDTLVYLIDLTECLDSEDLRAVSAAVRKGA